LLAPLFADRSACKVLHGADYDVRLLKRDVGLDPCGIFDTMVAARLLGEKAYGLAALLERHLGVRLDKRHQRADWSLRPLPAPMREYAALDTRHLRELAEILRTRLVAVGRLGWAEEEFRRIESLRWEPREPDPQAFLEVKGSAGLDRRGLAVLRELFALREKLARERDVARFRVARDEVLVALAGAAPTTREALERVRQLPRTWHETDAWLAAIARGRDVPEAALPQRSPRARPPRDPARERRLASLRHDRDRLARQLGLEPAVLAPRGVLEGLLDAQEAGRPTESVPGLRRWQAQVLHDVLRPGAPEPPSSGTGTRT
jgi:ribonuclease D